MRCHDDSITYADLNRLSDRIAAAIAREGVAPGKRIGIYMEKSISAVAAIFGILKAGCAYVPIDTRAPHARTRYIINDSRLDALFIENCTDDTLFSSLTSNGVKCIFDLSPAVAAALPHDCRSVRRADIENAALLPAQRVPSDTDDLAYVLYTSGSTGDPKGVMLSHKNAMAFIEWAAEYCGINGGDIVASHAPFHFDLSVFDIFTAVRAGAELCLVPPGVSCFPVSLADFVEKNRITVWYSVPSAIVQMLLQGNLAERDISALRLVAYAGETFPYKYLNRLRKIIPRAKIVNMYGLTETNVFTYYCLDDSCGALTDDVPIGVPCPYAEVRIVGRDGVPVPDGEEGELIVRGDSVMAGYMGDRERTAQVMRAMAGDGAGEKFFFTGDIVVRRDDGNLLFKNRTDSIVKIRGNRVNLADVEAVIHRHKHVRECAAMCIEDGVMQRKIKAFVVLEEGNNESEEALRRFCEEMVPAYMVPDIVEFRNELPKTSNGKIDMAQLRHA